MTDVSFMVGATCVCAKVRTDFKNTGEYFHMNARIVCQTGPSSYMYYYKMHYKNPSPEPNWYESCGLFKEPILMEIDDLKESTEYTMWAEIMGYNREKRSEYFIEASDAYTFTTGTKGICTSTLDTSELDDEEKIEEIQNSYNIWKKYMEAVGYTNDINIEVIMYKTTTSLGEMWAGYHSVVGGITFSVALMLHEMRHWHGFDDARDTAYQITDDNGGEGEHIFTEEERRNALKVFRWQKGNPNVTICIFNSESNCFEPQTICDRWTGSFIDLSEFFLLKGLNGQEITIINNFY